MKILRKGLRLKVRYQNSEGIKRIFEAEILDFDKSVLEFDASDCEYLDELEEGLNIYSLVYTQFGIIKIHSIILEKKGFKIIVEAPSDYQQMQRRNYLRVNVEMPIEISVNQKSITAKTLDISGGGARVISSRSLNEGDLVECKLKLNSVDVFAKGKILKKGSYYENEYLIIFTEIEELQRDRIIKFCLAEEAKFLKEGYEN